MITVLATALAESAGHGGEGGATLKLLPDLPTLVQQTILFAVLVGVLYKFAWKHILHALEAREGRIRGDLERAESARKEAEAVLAKHEEAMNQAKAEAMAILEEGKADAMRLKETVQAEAREEARKLSERARHEIALARDKAVADLQSQAAQLSIAMASKILGRELKAADQERLIREALSELPRQAMN